MRREKEEIVVLVRSTPEKSKRDGDGHPVGVIGINRNGEFLRLYPIGFRYGERLVDFKKNDVLEVTITKPEHDLRWESRKVLSYVNLQKQLKEREIKDFVLPLVRSVEKLNIEGASLGIIKPRNMDIEVKVNKNETYDREQYFNLIGDFLEVGERAGMPVEVRCTFKCEGNEACRGHKIILLDWGFNDNVREIIRDEQNLSDVEKKVRECFFKLIQEKELYFIVGTHFTYGTWLIIGFFCLGKKDGSQSNLSGY